jgi:D-glycero-alpha-D-manno-heptose-7-phosphate kinase
MFGGGSDHPAWFNTNEGCVISFAIDKYCYISLRELPPYFKHSYRVVYSKVETVESVEQIVHPAVREAFKKFGSGLKFELQHHGDLPAQSGVGSSSAFAVGLINALKIIKNEILKPAELANEAIHFEQIDLKETVGYQDQIACAIGGMNFIEFGYSSWQNQPILMSKRFTECFEASIVLVYSGISRISSDISRTLVENMPNVEKLMIRNVELAKEYNKLILSEGDLSITGEMLKESWKIKKQLNPSSITSRLEEFYELGLISGADGAKILGAGGGGFFLFWVAQDRREEFNHKMSNFIRVPVKISKTGSRIIA